MALPASRLDDKIHSARFRAFGGLVVDIQPHYCNILDPNIPQVQLSPVIVWNIVPGDRICVNTNAAWNLGATRATGCYSPCYDPTGAGHNLNTYQIWWGDGNTTGALAWPNAGNPPSGNYGAAANEWPLAAGETSHVYIVVIELIDNDGNSTTVQQQIEVVDCTTFPFMGYAGMAGGGIYEATTWTAINGNLPGGNWRHVNDIDVFETPSQRTLTIATDAGLAISVNDGDSWYLVPLDDPPNSWGDVPAPTTTDVNYTRLVRSNTDPNEMFILVNWQNGASQYRAWLLHTADGWDSWTWHNLGSNSQTVATWGYVQDWLNFQCATDPDEVDYSLVDPNDLIGPSDLAYGGGEMAVATAASTFRCMYLVLDLGTWVELRTVTADAGANVRTRVPAWTDTVTWGGGVERWARVHASELQACTIAGTWCGYGSIGVDMFTWRSGTGTYPPAVGAHSNLVNIYEGIYRPFRYILTTMYGGDVTVGGILEQLYDYFGVYPHAVHSEVWALGMDIDRKNGRWLYVTLWEGSALRLRVYDLQSSLTHPWCIQRIDDAVSSVELVNRTKWLKVYSSFLPSVGGDEFTAYGLFDYSGGANEHVAVGSVPYPDLDNCTFDFSIVDDGTWGAAHWAGDLKRYGPEEMYVVLNTGGAANLWYSGDLGANWTNRGAIGFSSEALDLHPDYYELIAGNRAAAGADDRMHYSMSDGASWFDVSTGLVAADDVRVVKLLSERS